MRQSGELLGVIFGVLLNLLLPEVFITVFLVALLSFNSFRTLRKGRQWWRKETAAMEKEAAKGKDTEMVKHNCADMEGDDTNALRRLSESKPSSAAELEDVPLDESKEGVEVSVGEVPERSPELQKLYDDAAVQFPAWSYRIILSMTGFTILYAYVKAFQIDICDAKIAYWLWYFSPVPVLGLAMFYIAYLLNQTWQERVKHGYHFLDTDVQFSVEQIKKFPLVALLAGLAAGMLGIGGGMVIGPLFIEIGMEPQVGTSSCAFMILWTATSGVVQYYFANALGWKFALYFMCVGFISGQVGQRLLNKVRG